MRLSKVLAKLRRNEPVILYNTHLTDPSVWELLSLMGLDCFWFDMEHHAHSMETANQLFRAARVGTADVIARPGRWEWMRMARMLEAGAHGILYPRCQDADEARQVVRWCKFAPLGERGADGGNPDMPYCTMAIDEYIEFANQQTFIVIQIEDEAALEQAEAIAAVEGVDALMLGPGDFSILSGIPGQMSHPKIQGALERIAAAARNTGKHWGTATLDRERIQWVLDNGGRLIFTGADILSVKNGFEQLRHDFEPLGFTFDNQLTVDKDFVDG